MNFTENNFDQEVLKSNVPVLVDFWASWCPPCRALGPTIDKLASELTTAKVGKVNTDEEEGLAHEYNIQALPTILIFKNGQVIKRFTGMQKEEVLRESLQ